MAKKPIRVLIVDDHAIVRAGCRRLLDSTSDIVVVGEAENAEQALIASRSLTPDIVILDISLPHQGGLAILETVKMEFPKLRVLILSVHEREPFPSSALRMGADGYLTKNCAPDELITAIRALAAGRQYISADIATCILLSKDNPEIIRLESLTPREREVFLSLSRGDSTGEIAKKLSISDKTVHVHRSRILKKLHARSQADLMGMAIKLGLIDPYADAR